MKRKPFKSLTYEQSKRKHGIMQCACSPFQVESVECNQYFITFIDEFVSAHLMESNADVFEKLHCLK